ncbi:uncharacterized protein G2W53_020494 [Senna tora]|uniref:Uncharacterized protein n=1 Tax=Senna tora TaxID=362788 RepID=A0A834U0G3_9FABA|nr:uncharacterized protein G2W53_020494 [Senna tora]
MKRPLSRLEVWSKRNYSNKQRATMDFCNHHKWEKGSCLSSKHKQNPATQYKKKNLGFVLLSVITLEVVAQYILHTSCPFVLVSLLTRLAILVPNLSTLLALNTSSSLVLLMGIVPSGHDSPDKLHS